LEQDFWKEHGAKFSELAEEERDLQPRGENGRLLVKFAFVDNDRDIHWILTGAGGENFRARFEALAARAGAMLDGGDSPFESWLCFLLIGLDKSKSPLLLYEGDGGGRIENVCEASSTICARLETLTLCGKPRSISGTLSPQLLKHMEPNQFNDPRLSGSVADEITKNDRSGASPSCRKAATVESGPRAKIDAFILRLKDLGHRVNRKDIWLVAGYRDRTEFERFQRGDKRTTISATRNFGRVLEMQPEDFIRQVLKNKRKS
jgi:hypothetical protein